MITQSITYSLTAFLIYVPLHITLTRLFRPKRYFMLSFLSFIIVGVMLALSIAISQRFTLFTWVNSGILFISLWGMYITFTFIILRSVSIRALVIASRADNHTIQIDTLETNYDTQWMFDARIDSLVLNGYLRCEDERYVLTRKGAFLAGVFSGVRRALNLKYGG